MTRDRPSIGNQRVRSSSVLRRTLAVIAALAAIALLLVLVGWMLPVRHQATREATLRTSPATVFALVSDVAAYPQWRTGVTRVELLPAADGGMPRFREHGADGAILYEIAERVPDRRLVTRIADRTLPFGGQWTYEIAPAPGGATLRITEDGEVYNPVFRLVSRFVLGHTRSLDRYLADVRARVERPAGGT